MTATHVDRRPSGAKRLDTGRTRRRRALASTLLLAGLGAAACAEIPLPRVPGVQPAITEEELREELVAFASRFEGVVSTAADRIRTETRDPAIRRRALLWEIRMTPLVRETAFAPDPQEAFVAVNGVVAMMRRYLTVGDGSTIFGAQQPIATEAAVQLEEDFYEIAAIFLSEEEVERLQEEVESYAQDRAISGSDFATANVRRRVREAREAGRFDWVVNLPMSPFRALEGVGSGAEAIHDFNDTAIRFAQIVESLPEQLRWQSQLLLYDVEARESLIRALAALEAFAGSALQLAAVAEQLPGDVEALLGDSQGALAEANRTLATAQGLVGPLRATAEQMNLAGASWGALFQRDGEPDPDGRPFDIREYEATARGIGEAAREVRGLAEELGVLAESPGLDGAVSRAESGGRSVVDHAAWRGLQLLLAFFALLLAYRLVAPRLAPRPPR